MSLKKSVIYALYASCFIGILLLLQLWSYHMRAQISITGNIGLYPLIAGIMYSPLGVMLGVPIFLKQFNKTGNWKVNWEKFIFLGLPLLYFASYMFFVYYAPFFANVLAGPLPIIVYQAMNTGLGTQISGLVLGYVIMTSFYKAESEELSKLEQPTNIVN